MHYELTEVGLVFTATPDEQEEIANRLAETDFWTVFFDTFEGPLDNGLTFVYPEEIDALTDSPIFADRAQELPDQFPRDTRFFWFPNYQIQCPLHVLAETGHVMFVEGTHEEKEKVP